MTSSQSQRRRELARRQRYARRRGVAVAAFSVSIFAALAAVALTKSHAHHTATASAHRARGPARSPAAADPPRSAIGLPLGKPQLTLMGIGDPAQDTVHSGFLTPPRAGLLFNVDTGQVLWQRNAAVRLRIASLTKMMTALLTVSSDPPNARVLVTRQAVESAGSKVGVLPLGRDVRLESLLYGLLLPSGNDASIALAQHVAGSVSSFVSRMNAEAAALGMGCTRYSSPSGYYDVGNFSCAADLALLAHVDLQQPRIARVTRTAAADLPFPIGGGHLYLYNNNPLLIYHYPGLTGLKTGYTLAAGKCLVATATRDGVSLGVVLLHSPDPGTQASYLLNRGFEGVYHQRAIPQTPIPEGE